MSLINSEVVSKQMIFASKISLKDIFVVNKFLRVNFLPNLFYLLMTSCKSDEIIHSDITNGLVFEAFFPRLESSGSIDFVSLFFGIIKTFSIKHAFF